MKQWLFGALVATVLTCGAVEAQSKRLSSDVVDKDFRVTVQHSGSGALGSFSVVGNLATDVVRVPLFKGTEAVMVVEVGAETYSVNNNPYVRPQVRISVEDPTRVVPAGEGAARSFVLLSCERAIDWNDPGKLVVLDGESVNLAVTIEVEADGDAE